MRVALTGAGGYVGTALARVLAARGTQVVGFDRAAPRVDDVFERFVRADLREPVALRELVRDADAVVHLAAYVHRAADSAAARAACLAINHGGTVALLDAIAAGGRAVHVVFASSTAVYGAEFEQVREDAPLHPVSAYGEGKLAAERAVLEAAGRGAIRACVLRPAVVYGRGAPGNTQRLARLVQRGWVPRVGGGGNRKSMVHVDDLCAAFAAALGAAPSAGGMVWNVAGDAITVRGMVEAIARGVGVTPRWLPVPGPVFDAMAATARLASRASGGWLPDVGRALEVFAGEASVDASAIARDLAVTFRSTAAGLEAIVRDAA